LITDGMAKALARAGCREVWLGAESGSQRILDAMNKGTTIAEIVTARQRLGRCGIRVGFFIQLGYLGEQLDDIVATRRLLHSANPDDIGVSVSYPLPGTKFYDAVKEQLGQKTHWRESNDLAMMFHGTFTSDFYRAVRNYLHDEVTARVSGAIADAATLTAFNSRWEALMLSAEQHYAAGDPAGVNRPHSNTLNLQEVMVGQ
jgi:anaerobic magnesium-protoporphyrin IX monomethyl ester cyclase